MQFNVDRSVCRLLVKCAVPNFSMWINTDLLFESFNCGNTCSINNLLRNIIYAFSRLSNNLGLVKVSDLDKDFRYLNCSEMIKKEALQ